MNSNETTGTRRIIPAAEIEGAHVAGMAAYDKLVAEADANYSGYW